MIAGYEGCLQNMKYTLVIKQGQDGFLIGQLKELPAVFSQGLTVSELKENIADVLELYLEDMREKYSVYISFLRFFLKKFCRFQKRLYLCAQQ